MTVCIRARRRTLMLLMTTWLVATPVTPQAQITSAPQTVKPSWQMLDARADDLATRGKIALAVEAARAALAAATTSGERGQSLGLLGSILLIHGSASEAEQHLRESLEIRTASSETSLEYAQAAHDFAVFLRDTGRREEAIKLGEKAATIRRRLLPVSDWRVAQGVDTLGSIYMAVGDYDKALTTELEADRLFEQVEPTLHGVLEYGVHSTNLGGLYQRLGKYRLALTTLEAGRRRLATAFGPEHVVCIANALVLASLKVEMGDLEDAERLYETSMRAMLVEFTEEHVLYLGALNNRGVMYRGIGEYERAEQDLQRAVDLKSASPQIGRRAVTTAASLGNLAHLIYRRNRPAAEAMLREAADILAESKRAPAYEQINVLVALTRVEYDRGRFDEAMATLRQATEIAERAFGRQHPLYAATLREQGRIRQAAGDGPGAERVLLDALGIVELAYGASNPHLLTFLRPLARTYEAQRNHAAALATHRREFDIEDEYLTDVFSLGSEGFKETVLASLVDPVNALIAFQRSVGEGLPDARTLAFEAATRRKGRVLEQVRSLRERLHGLPSAANPLIDRLTAIGQCRMALSTALGGRSASPSLPGDCSLDDTDLKGQYELLLGNLRASPITKELRDQAKEAIAALHQRERAIELSLVELYPVEARPAPARLEQIASALEQDERLIELVAYFDGGQEPENKAYGAFILGRDRTLTWVDLGAAAPIDTAANDLLQAANDWTVARREGETKPTALAEARATKALDCLTQLAWQRIEPHLSSAVRRLRIAPDSSLNLVPFEALRTGEGSRLIDRYVISYLPAGRDLVARRNALAREPASVVVSDGMRKAGRAAARQVEPELLPLPGAKPEGRYLRDTLPDARLFMDDKGSEFVVKQLGKPIILHIISHARVRADRRCPSGRCDEKTRRITGTVMTTSEMILQEHYANVPGSKEDGLLTAAELQNIDLHGTAMLVLSQCQMASGLPSVGEGVYGMRRAAAIAGAQTFVAPLWNVHDRTQRRLMKTFYDGLGTGLSRAEALREAKLAIKASADTRSFLDWAPVILFGDASPLALAVDERNAR
jgi:CHAT domain-containing protein